ncbi:hypothetical protein J2S13_000914 [Oikeobacillus pervagus]|uniref:Uncharacterized protein n=1 Tax=Oikeobacillus pervagus TaxID=1325931 RepID=A0AAJ1WIK3_9BACI|nr:hypothetical protein [Oikeobacillus pervagus]
MINLGTVNLSLGSSQNSYIQRSLNRTTHRRELNLLQQTGVLEL